MVKLSEMSREELLEVIMIKDRIIEELKEQIAIYEELVAQLQKNQIK